MKLITKVGLALTIMVGFVVALFAFGLLAFYNTPLETFNGIQVNNLMVHPGLLPDTPNCSSADNAYATLSLRNPGSSQNISRIVMNGFPASIGSVSFLDGGKCTALSAINSPFIGGGGAVTNVTVFLGGSSNTQSNEKLSINDTVNMVIYFSNGEEYGATVHVTQ
jgi:hypothetical protein